MTRPLKKRSGKSGLPPGSLVYTGQRSAAKVRLRLTRIEGEGLEQREVGSLAECFPLPAGAVTWIEIEGVHEPEVVRELGERLGVHPLLLEDIMHIGQRPKLEDFGDYLFIVLQLLRPEGNEGAVRAEQVSLILGRGYVVSLREGDGDAFGLVRQRLQQGQGRLRRLGADYLAYALIDTVVDGYFGVLEGLGERIERLEEQLVARPGPVTLTAIHQLKREMISLRRSVWPLREVAGRLERTGAPLIAESTALYFKDVYDHTIEVIETLESLRDTVSGMLDVYLSSVSNRLNEVMKVLTVIATIFIPLTFIAGVYGMNFQHMPELSWRWGYTAVWVVMLAVAGAMLVYFKRKNWF
jgi:magnesium transporter